MNKDFIEIVKAAQAGDDRAFEALYNMTKDPAYFIAFSITKNEQDAQDIMQDSYIKAFSNINTVDPPEMFDNWFNRIVANESKNYIKKKKPVLFADADNEIQSDWNEEELNKDYIPHVSLDSNETSRLIMEIINSLPEDKRLCILMYYYQDMSVAEISQALELSVSNVKYKLLSARKEIKRAVEDLEKRDTKLYGAMPLAALPAFLENGAKLSALNHPTPAYAGIAAAGAVSAPAITTTSTSGAAAVFAKTATGGIGTLLKTTMAKIIATILAVVIVGGGVAAAVVMSNKMKPSDNGGNSILSNEQQDDNLNSVNEQQEDNQDSANVQQNYDDTDITLEALMSYEESPAEDFWIEDNGDGTATIIDYTGMDEIVVIPEKIDGLTIVNIEYFNMESLAVAIRLPDTVENINRGAFGLQNNLEIFVCGKNLKTIDACAFQESYYLREIVLNEGLKSIGEQAFESTDLTEITIPGSVTSIGNDAFAVYNDFIGYDADAPYKGLVIKGVAGSAAEDYAKKNGITFQAIQETNNQQVTASGEITVEDVLSAPATPASDFKYSYHEETKGIMIEYYTGNDEIVVIPDTIDGEPVTFLKAYAFSGTEGDGNSDVRVVKMPDSVYAIGRCAFEDNDSIEIVICGTGMKRILENNFYYCQNLKYIYVPSALELLGDRGNGVFWDLDKECVVKSIDGSLIDDKIKQINEAFPDNTITFEPIE